MNPWLSVAVLTWNLIGTSLFIGYPSVPVVQVCVNDEWCFTPSNRQGEVIPWDGPPPIVRAVLADGSEQWAVPYPSFSG